MRALIGCGLCFFLVVDSASADTTDAEKIVGQWSPINPKTKQVYSAATATYTKDGKYSLTAAAAKGLAIEATYTIDDKKLKLAYTADPAHPRTFTIKKLTDTEMTLYNQTTKQTEYYKKVSK